MRNLAFVICAICMGIGAFGQNVGIGTVGPSHALHVAASANPLRLEGLQAAADTDGTLTVDALGIVRRRAAGGGGGSSTGWALTGNASIDATTNFIGTISTVVLNFRTNNFASGFIDPSSSKRNNAFGNGAMANTSISGIAYTGSANNAFGYQALRQVNFGSGNVAFGDSALYAVVAGSNNVAVGPFTLKTNLSSDNIAIGANVLERNINGSNNIGIGVGSLASGLTAVNNLAIGGEALRTTLSNDNVAVGYRSGFALTVGSQNTAVGNFAMAANISGSNNTYLGYQAAQLHTTGSGNTYLGYLAGGNFAGGSNNTMVGGGADVLNPNAVFSNSTALGAGAIVDRSNMIRLGNSSITRIEAAVSLTVPSDGRVKRDVEENIPGLAFIGLLRPVSYHYDLNKWDAIVGNRPAATSSYAQKESIRYSGFIAQEVYQSAKALGYDFSGVSAPINEKGLYGIAYAEMVVPLVKAVQELKLMAERQQAEIDRLNSLLEKLSQR